MSSPTAKAQFVQQAGPFTSLSVSNAAGYGSAVAFSGDGNTAVVGAPRHNRQGAVYVLTKSGSSWITTATLMIPLSQRTPLTGFSVDISHDGHTIIVGTPGNNEGARIFAHNGNTWREEAHLQPLPSDIDSEMGWSVAISADGNTALLGSITSFSRQSTAWLYERTGSTWTFHTQFFSSGSPDNTMAGGSIAISDDGKTLVIGAHGANNGQGTCTVFSRAAYGRWLHEAHLTGSGGASAGQGFSVAISADGNTIIAGGPYDNSNRGAAWIFTRSGTTWQEQAKLVGSGAVSPGQQGNSVAISADGNTAVVGGFMDNNQQGATWVFKRSANRWNQESKLLGSGGMQSLQGSSVAITADGKTLITGGKAHNKSLGAVWIFSVRSCEGIPIAGTPSQLIQTHCPGSTTVLTVNGSSTFPGVTYQWQESDDNGVTQPWRNAAGGSGATTTTYTLPANLNVTRSYRLKVTCTFSGLAAASAFVRVEVPAAPVISPLPATVSVCEGSPLTLSIPALGTGFFYQWQKNSGSGFVNISGANAATYIVTKTTYSMTGDQYRVLVTGSCSITATSEATTLTVKPAPAVKITALKKYYCQSDDRIIPQTDTPGGTFYLGQSPISYFEPRTLTPGLYLLRYQYTDAAGCTGRDSASFEIKPLPEVQILSLAASYCQKSQVIQLQANPKGGSFYLDNSTSPLTQFDPATLSPGTHQVRYNYADSAGCIGTAQATFEISPVTYAKIAGIAAQYCTKDAAFPLAATAPGGTFTIDGAPATLFDPAKLSPGKHTIRYSYGEKDCGNDDEVTTTVYAPPVTALEKVKHSCAGQTLVLDAAHTSHQNPENIGKISYLWNTGATTPSIPVSQSGVYFVTVKHALACAAVTDTVHVSFNALPLVDMGKDFEACAGDSVLLNAKQSSHTSAFKYKWNNGATSPQIKVSGKNTVLYTVTVTDETYPSACEATGQVRVTFKEAAAVNLGADVVLCDSLQLPYRLENRASGHPAGTTYRWTELSRPDGMLSSQDYFSASKAGHYRLTAFHPNGCERSDTVRVSVNARVKLPARIVGCEGDTVRLSGRHPDRSARYLWHDGDTSAIRAIQKPGIYRLRTRLQGCEYADSTTVIFTEKPRLQMAKDTVFCFAKSIEDQTQKRLYRHTVAAKVTNPVQGSTYEWYATADLKTVLQQGMVEKEGMIRMEIEKGQSPAYLLKVKTPDGCLSSQQVNIREFCEPKVKVPTAFTPNGDHLNDVFAPLAHDIEGITIKIYHRWGDLVFEKIIENTGNQSFDFEEKSDGWDGTYRGKHCPADAYTYVITYRGTDENGKVIQKTLTGTVQLIRESK